MPESEANQAGHWESRPIAQFNDRLLEALGCHWAEPEPTQANFNDIIDVQGWTAEATDILLDQYENADRPVIKDPRISRLLPVWEQALANCEIRPSFLIACRNPVEVALSLLKRDGMDQNHALLLWQSYMLEAERDTRRYPRTFVHFEKMLSDWRSVLTPMLGPSGAFVEQATNHHGDEINQFIDPDLASMTLSFGELSDEISVPPPIAEAYSLFCNGDGDGQQPAFDRLRIQWQNRWRSHGPKDGLSDYVAELPQTYIARSRDLINAGNIEEAIEAAKTAVSIAPNISRLHFFLGDVLLRAGQLQAAERSLNQAISLYANDHRYHSLQARILTKLGRSTEAEMARQRALELEPG